MYRTVKKLLFIGVCGALLLACTWHLVNESLWDDAVSRQVSSTPSPRSN
ncbi:hypothetical protein [Cohnella sp. JJ-181]|nr:hypothetical protein [Cohnella sp. JJ-181]CAI6087414.1 hypothetical protein COHCIP112018_05517 [Cohnella sp. JJ-181]